MAEQDDLAARLDDVEALGTCSLDDLLKDALPVDLPSRATYDPTRTRLLR